MHFPPGLFFYFLFFSLFFCWSMVDGGGRTAFPVVFYDGEREMNIGNVEINPALEYKPFQLMLSQMIGISPNQISIYLVDRKRNPTLLFTEDRRRIPITGKVNFGLICRQKDCYFLVVLKRSRKSRNRRERIIDEGVDYEYFPPPVPDNIILLRRDQPTQFYDQITQSELSVLNRRLQNVRVERESYSNLSEDFGVPSTLCSECVREENAGTTSFHPCIRDAVVTRFKTRFGPINRPGKPFPWKLYQLFPKDGKQFLFL